MQVVAAEGAAAFTEPPTFEPAASQASRETSLGRSGVGEDRDLTDELEQKEVFHEGSIGRRAGLGKMM